MNHRDPDAAVRNLITQYEALYDRYQNDPFRSVVCASARDELRQYRAQLQSGITPEALLTSLQARLPELIKLRESEELHPTFDWYDEHYHYKVLDGQCDACREMIRLLEEFS